MSVVRLTPMGAINQCTASKCPMMKIPIEFTKASIQNIRGKKTMAEKMVDRVMRIMKKPTNIRNIAICAHIDHGNY